MIATWLVFVACQTRPQPPASLVSEAGHLVIAHTNDLHAHFDANRADWMDGARILEVSLKSLATWLTCMKPKAMNMCCTWMVVMS